MPRLGLASIAIRLAASPAFRRMAIRFPLTRPIARREAACLFDLAAGFVYSQILAAFIALDLPDILHAAPKDAEWLGSHLAIPAARIRRLLDAACALGLAKRRGTNVRGSPVYALGRLGAPLVGNAAVQAMVTHHALLYDDLRDPLALLRDPGRDTRLARFWNYDATSGEDRTGPYTSLMAMSVEMVRDEILATCDLGASRVVLDVGGGDGSLALSLAEAEHDLRITSLDLPSVSAAAMRRFAASPHRRRLGAIGIDFHREAWPEDADTIILSRILHDHDDGPAQALLVRARRALPEGGRLIVAEPLADTPGSPQVGDAYFGIYLLAMGSGRPRQAATLERMLREAGFTAIRHHRPRMGMMTGILTAS